MSSSRPLRGAAAARRPFRAAHEAARAAAIVRALACAGFAACAGLALAGRAEPARPLDLAGTWYVLIHYRDPGTANPDADRWKDLVWVFERAGSRLEWTEYPIVVFDDTTGRFEARDGNPRSRVLAAWEPNVEQQRTIDAGPRVNRRGMRTKTLRGSDARGWRSPRRPGGAISATTLTYTENLTIEGLDALPRFAREDVLGNTPDAPDRGGTLYVVERIQGDGRLMEGRYERDGRQKGTFRMWRTEPVRGLGRDDEDAGGDGPSGGASTRP